MKYGFVKVASATPEIRVADTTFNGQAIRNLMIETAGHGAKVVVFPELAITGYTCGDLFLQKTLLEQAKAELVKMVETSKDLDAIFFVGLPYEIHGKLYNMAAVISHGEILGMIPKSFLPNHDEFQEARYFTKGEGLDTCVTIDYGQDGPVDVLVNTDMIFRCDVMPQLKVGVEICEDLWVACPPSIRHTYAGATVIANLSASNEIAGKAEYRKNLINMQSSKLICGYIYASTGEGESTQDVVFSGHNVIAENGRILAESGLLGHETVYSEIDVEALEIDRRRNNNFEIDDSEHTYIDFHLEECVTSLSRIVKKTPFVPAGEEKRNRRAGEVFAIQAMGLKKRMAHTNAKTAVIGISGGLDSTLALLVTVKAFALLGKDRQDIIAVTMPGFGTTDRTYTNAVAMIEKLGVTFMEIDIKASVRQHFADIGHDENVHDVTYENAQARERTQILMDVANRMNGMVIGTGDMSELALGWATYNGDHMSMYGVNAGVPKTLVRHLVRYYADVCGEQELAAVLYDVLDTPVSPELLPPQDNGEIAQITEDLVGPYELHDFFIYHALRFGYTPAKIYHLAQYAFEGKYEDAVIRKWLKNFYRRFFAQQFKRSCLPDGPKVGSLSMSPRGDLRMPSDACARIWLDEVEKI